MPCDVTHRKTIREQPDQFAEDPVLRCRERMTPVAFELDAHRMIIAAGPAAKPGGPSMPGTIVDRDELQQGATSANEKVR